MSVAVKVWISIMLLALVGLTAVTLIKITRNPAARPVGETTAGPSDDADDSLPSKPLDLASFEMTERSGEKFNFEELRGTVWVASLFFSSCPHQCRQLNESIAALQRDEILEEVKFVSISVDPTVDTPERLAEYAELFKADPKQWLFLQGDMPQVDRFGKNIGVTAGFKTHTRRLVLFDHTGQPRGYFAFNDPAALIEMRKLVPVLLSEKEKAETVSSDS